MALKRLGTNANNSLYAIVFAPPQGVGEAAAASILAPADLAAIAQSIVSDKNFAATNPKGILGTGTTHSNATLDTLAYTAGAGLAAINVGMLVLGAGILPGTFVIAKPTPTSVTLSQAATASAAGVRVAYDTNYRAKLWGPAEAAAAMHAAIAQCDIVLPSLDDAITLTGLVDPDAIIDFYLRLGPSLVVLKRGAEGALLATSARRMIIPPFPCTPVDATGAGDAFCGSFLARLILGDTPEDAARYAGCAAALKCEGYGAVAPIPHAAQVLEKLAG